MKLKLEQENKEGLGSIKATSKFQLYEEKHTTIQLPAQY